MKKLSQCPAPPMRVITEDGQEVSFTNPLPVGEGWEILTVSDVTDNDADKSFAVDAGYIWHILSIRIEYTASADAGDRQLAVQLTDNAGTVLDEILVGAVVAASETRYFEIAPGLADLTDFRDTDWLMTPLQVTAQLGPLHHVRVLDRNAISPGADDMYIRMRYGRKQL